MSTPKIIQKIIGAGSDQKLAQKALDFAKAAHAGQKRYSGENYISHPQRVAEILSQMGMDSQTIAAGLLHDVIDDTKKTINDIEKEFGREVAFLVAGVSKLGKLRYPKTGLEIKTMQERTEEPIDLRAENLRKMFFAMGEDLRVVLIKLADRLHNMETLGALPAEKQKRIALETLEIFVPLADRLGIGEMRSSLQDLAFPYLYPKEHEELMKSIKDEYQERAKHLEKAKEVLIKILKDEGIKPIDIHSRPKHRWSLYQKLLTHNMDLSQIYDLIALRVIVQDVKTCYQVLGILHKHWRPFVGRIKDYIASPKPNGYQALHTTVFCSCPESKILEVQIKTAKMHREAETGIAAHWALKQGINLTKESKRFAWVGQLRNWEEKILKLKHGNKKKKDSKITWVRELNEWQEKISEPKDFLEGLKVDFFKNRIFVFTPMGDVIDLPEGATPIDFAYAVHTEVGNKCAAAKVNSKMAALSHVLANGDMVEIVLDKNKIPSGNWLEFAKTNAARSKIKNWLKQKTRPENLARGTKELDQLLKDLNNRSFAGLGQTKKEELLKIFAHKDIESLLVAIGEGEISPQEVVKKIFKNNELSSQAPKTQPHVTLKTKTAGTKVKLAGQKGLQVFLSKCCTPRAGQQVKAYITRNRGGSIHRENCVNLIRAQQKWPYKVIDASWEEEV